MYRKDKVRKLIVRQVIEQNIPVKGLTFEERLYAFEQMNERGDTADKIAYVLGVSNRTVKRWRAQLKTDTLGNRNYRPPTHGTNKGYAWHRRYNIPECDPCRIAHNVEMTRYRNRTKDKQAETTKMHRLELP